MADFGSMEALARPDDPVSQLPFEVRRMARAVSNGRLDATWGSQNDNFPDRFFDYLVHGEPLPQKPESGPQWRPVGAPGLLLFHLVSTPEVPYTVAALGIGIPLGGPDHFAARPLR